MAKRNIPFVINRWTYLRDLTNNLYIWDLHPKFANRPSLIIPSNAFNLNSGFLVKNCGNPIRAFNNLVNFQCSVNNEVSIYTDGSKFDQEEGPRKVGTACWIPSLSLVKRYKLNNI